MKINFSKIEDVTVLSHITNDVKDIDLLEKLYSKYETELEEFWIYNDIEYKYCFKVFNCDYFNYDTNEELLICDQL